MAAGDDIIGQVRLHPGVRFPVIQRVQIAPSVDGIGTRTACQRVVSGLAIQSVCAFSATQVVIASSSGEGIFPETTDQGIHTAVTCQNIVIGRSPDILNAGNRVTSGMAARSRTVCQVHPDTGIRPAIIQGIHAITSIYDVCACSPPDQVISRVADQCIGVRSAIQVITTLSAAIGQQNNYNGQGQTQDQ